LTTAVVTAELLPALTNPFATLTVFAPTNVAFDNLVATLGITLTDVLAFPLANLQSILLYHVLGAEVLSSDITNGLIASPLNTSNTLKITLTSASEVFINQAQVTMADVTATNGVVHVIDAVLLPAETVVDVAIDNGFTTLTTAVVTAELLPALTDPFGTFTVFAPTNLAFTNLASALGISLADILALPNLGDILLYHVVGTELEAINLTAGALLMLNGQNTQVDLTSGVMINSSTVSSADIFADNGVVHVIDAVLIYNNVSINENEIEVSIYPNPVSESLTILSLTNAISNVSISNMLGQVVYTSDFSQPTMTINIQDLNPGQYVVTMTGDAGVSRKSIVISNN
jgi:transforming growth factor-beta-induced protein